MARSAIAASAREGEKPQSQIDFELLVLRDGLFGGNDCPSFANMRS